MAGIAGRSGRKRSDTTTKIIDLWNMGESAEDIAEAVGCTYHHVLHKLKDYHLSDTRITANYLAITGIGDQWEETCEWYRKYVFTKPKKKLLIGETWDEVCQWFRDNIEWEKRA